MEFTFATPALLFSAISLILLAYTNRFHALASLLREIRAVWVLSRDPKLAAQMENLRKRIKIIQWMQILGVGAFIMGVVSILLLFFDKTVAAEISFAGGLFLMMASLIFSLWELSISVKALDILLDDTRA